MQLLLLLLCAMGALAIPMDVRKQLHDHCTAEVGADKAVMDDYVERATKGDFVDDWDFKCYAKCIMMTGGMLTEENGVDEQRLIDAIPYIDNFADVVHGCGTIWGENLCETAYNQQRCYQKADPTTYFMV